MQKEFKIQSRYVAFCDVIGFKKIIMTEKLLDVVNRYNSLIEDAKRIAESVSIPNLNHFHEYNLSYTIFSDSIFAWSDSFSNQVDDIWKYDNSFLHMVSILFGLGLQYNLPFRIGIAYGECIINPEKNIFLGIPLIEAYETEGEQEWIGIACHQSCLNSPISQNLCFTTTEGISCGAIIPYNVPYKPKSIRSSKYTLDWPKWINNSEGVEKFIENRILTSKKEKYQRKWEKTLDFYTERCKELRIINKLFIGGNYHSP